MRRCLPLTALGAGLALAGCLSVGDLLDTALDQVGLTSLVQRVQLVPGADALDPGPPTAVGTDWRKIHIFFTEPLRSGTTILPSIHLSVDGPGATDPSTFFSDVELSTLAFGGIRTRSRLTLTLTDAGAVPEGLYTIGLISPAGANLVGESGEVFEGTFLFRVQVETKDGVLPYIVRMGTLDGTPVEGIDLGAWLNSGTVSVGQAVAPHAGLRVEFSERMRTAVPVEVTPQAPGELITFEIFGGFEVSLQNEEAPGVSLVSAEERASWADVVDGLVVSRPVTTLTTDTEIGLELATSYALRFPSTPAVSSTQSVTVDRSGEPLTLRFVPTTAQFDEEVIRAMREVALADTRVFTTAPVRVDSPVHRSFLNANKSPAPGGKLEIVGTVAEETGLPKVPITEVRVSIQPATDSVPSGSGLVANIDPAATANRVGVRVHSFSAFTPVPLLFPDGDYKVFAEARTATGLPPGFDVIRFTKDTAAPQLFVGGEVEILATDSEIPRFCVNVSADTVNAELVLNIGQPTEQVLASASEPSTFDFETGLPNFCFGPLAIPAGFFTGANTWTIRLTDAAGNVALHARFLRIRPVITNISPAVASAGDITTVTVIGRRIPALITPSDFGVFDRGVVGLDHDIRADSTAGVPIFIDSTFLGFQVPFLTPINEVRLIVPEFAASGPFAFRLDDGTLSTSAPLTICSEIVGSFVADGQAGLGAGETPTFLGAIGLTGMGSPALVEDAGEPVVFSFSSESQGTFFALGERTYDRAAARWSLRRVIQATDPLHVPIATPARLTGAVAAAQGPGGDVQVAYARSYSLLGFSFNDVYVANRVLLPGSLFWEHTYVDTHGRFQVAARTSTALDFAVSSSGQAGLAYVLPNELADPTLFAALETTPGNFETVAVDNLAAAPNVENGVVSVGVDSRGRLWIAHDFGTGISVWRVERTAGELTTQQVAPVSTLISHDRPSLVIDPLTDLPVAAHRAEGFGILYRRFNGIEWVVEGVGAALSGVTALDLTVDVAGTARVAFGDADGTIRLATRTGPQLPNAENWRKDLLETTPQPDTFVAAVLDGVGSARVAYHDAELQSLRVYREDDRGPLVSSNGEHVCAAGRYVQRTFPAAATDFSATLAANSDFLFTLENVSNLNFELDGLRVFSTALTDHRVTLESDPDRKSFELFIDSPELSAEVSEIRRLHVAFFEDPNPITGVPFARARVAPVALLPDELELRVEDPAIARAQVGCCPSDAEGGCIFAPEPEATCDEFQAGMFGPAPTDPIKNEYVGVVNCFGTNVMVRADAEDADGDPVGVPVCSLQGFGATILDLEDQLPFLPANEPIGEPLNATLVGIRAVFERIFVAGETPYVPTGSQGGPGKLTFELPVTELFVDMDGVDLLGSELDVDMVVVGADLRIRSTGTLAVRERPIQLFPFGVLRHRFGRPAVVAPEGSIQVAPDDIGLSFPDGENPPFFIQDFARMEISKALGNPDDELEDALNDLSRQLAIGVTDPLLGAVMTDAETGRFGVTLQLGPDNQIRSVTEPTNPPGFLTTPLAGIPTAGP